jgi:hypothetical protein
MQTGIWMTYLDSTHFSKQFLYKILFIPSYSLEDINNARFKIFWNFGKTENGWGCFLTEEQASRGRLPLGPWIMSGR